MTFNLRVAYGFLQTFVVNGREKNTPKFNKEYLWNHCTELDHAKLLGVKYLQLVRNSKIVSNIFMFMCILFNYWKIQFYLRNQTLGFAKHVFLTGHATFLSDGETANSSMFSWTLSRMNGSGIFKMAALNRKGIQQNDFFPFRHLIATRFQQLYPCYRGRPYQWDMYPYCTSKLGENWKCNVQDGGLHPRNAYISAPRLASNAIPTAIPMFSGSAKPMGHASIPYVYNGRKTEV